MTDSITVEGRTLAAALKPILLAIERRNTIPILSCVKLAGLGNELVLTGTDLDIEISTTIDLIARDGDFILTCVPAKVLYDIAKSAGPAPMEITYHPKHKEKDEQRGGTITVGPKISINVADGDAVYTDIQAYAASDYPAMQSDDYEFMENFTNGRLAMLLEKVIPCISTEETRYYLNGVNWSRKDGTSHMAATDGHRLTATRYGLTDAGEAAFDLIIPAKTARLVAKLTEGKDVGIRGRRYDKPKDNQPRNTDMDRRFLQFVFGRTAIRSKTIDGTFPDYRRVIPKREEAVHKIEFDRDHLRAALDRVSFMTTERGRAARIHLGVDGKTWLSIKTPDTGDATAKTFAAWPAEHTATQIGFNSGSPPALEFFGCHSRTAARRP